MKQTTAFLVVVCVVLLGWEIYALREPDVALITTAVRYWDDASGGIVMGIFLTLIYHFFFRKK